MLKIKELRELSREKILEKEQELRKVLFDLRLQHALKQLKNTSLLLGAKKDIARVMTVINSPSV